MKKERIAGVDIVKSLAAVFVISIHQIGMTHVMDMTLTGARPFIIVLYRYLVMSCVPLFLLATGYLQCNKKADKRFYLGVVPIIASYLFSSIFAVWVNVRMAGESFHLGWSIIHILNFTENNYAWYVEMFIGLYLVIPFLNMAYRAIPNRRLKLTLIGILIFLTAAPSIPLVFNTKEFYFDILPDYWTIAYPVTYYLVGVYFREYQPEMKKGLNLVLIAAAALIPTMIEFVVAQGGYFDDYAYIFNGFNSMSACVIAVLIFQLFYRTDIRFRPAKAMVRSVSVATLEIYLLSNLVEKCVYPIIPQSIPARLAVMIAVVFVLSFIAAKVQRGIFWCAQRAWSAAVPRRDTSVSG